MDEKLAPRPQMVDKWTVSDDKLTYTFTLRDGLEWHDGAPVTSEDCIASIKRWGAKDSMGQALLARVAEMKPVDARTFTMVLKEPYGLVLQSLAIPRGQVALAKGTAAPGDDRIVVEAVRGSPENGIASTAFLEHAFRTDSYRFELNFHPDGSISYVSDTILMVRGQPEPFVHRDANRLTRIGEAQPNPLMQLVAKPEIR